jgi:hypothetical protein
MERPPNPHVKENTPLFIGFTRNWRLIQQVVVSYITSGWPAEDIYVVENTGVMDSDALGLLPLQNPFFLNHTRLQMLGVNVLVTPTLLTFAPVITPHPNLSVTESKTLERSQQAKRHFLAPKLLHKHSNLEILAPLLLVSHGPRLPFPSNQPCASHR